jgi:hypothetical protein
MNLCIAFWSTLARWSCFFHADKLAEYAYGKAALANLRQVNARISRD